MKKLAVFLMAATLILGLAGCGNRNEGNDVSQTGDTQESSEADTATESISEPESQPESDQQPEPDQQPGDESSQMPGDGESSQMPEDGISEQMSAIRQAVVDVLGDNYWPDSQIPPEYLEFYGLTSDMYADFWGEMPMISANVDTLIVIQANEGQIDAVEEVLNSYRDTQVNNTMQYPKNVGIVQASRIEVVGDYACFVQLGADTMEAMEAGDEAVISHCQQLNETALEAIERVIQQ